MLVNKFHWYRPKACPEIGYIFYPIEQRKMLPNASQPEQGWRKTEQQQQQQQQSPQQWQQQHSGGGSPSDPTPMQHSGASGADARKCGKM